MSGKISPRPRPSGWTQRIGRLHPAVIVGTAALIAVAVVTTLVLVGSGGGSNGPKALPSPTEPLVATVSPTPFNAAQSWMDATTKDLDPLKGVIIAFLQTNDLWVKGKTTDAEIGVVLPHSLEAFQEARAKLDKRTAFPQAPRALDDYRASVSLYLQAGRVVQAGSGTPAGPLHTQLTLQYRRVLYLADRLFDQARAELKPYLPAAPSLPDIVQQPGAEVPDWASLELAAGPPLDAVAARTHIRIYQKSRPTQSLAAWKSSVERARVPSAGALAAGISGLSAPTLRSLSDACTAASNAIYAAPDPQGERPSSTRVQLGLLVDSESARAAQAAALLPKTASAARTELIQVAQTLAVLGDGLWDSRLGARSTGFPPSLLTT